MTQPIESLWQQPVILLDGATGTWLQKAGMAGGSPEKWVLEHKEVLRSLQEAYYAVGSRIIYAFTFGANRVKLKQHGFSEENVEDINKQMAAISCDVRDAWQNSHPGSSVFVAGDLAPTGAFLAPAGTLSFAELVAIYKQQVHALLAAGVDLFVIETMFDLAQTRAAVLAIRDLCDLPVFVTMTLEAHGRTLSGNTPLTCLLSLAELGVQAFGLNCSHGPEKLGEWLSPLVDISPIPLIAKPNAGLPREENGQTVFPMDPGSFADNMQTLADQGIRLLGGCCGTTPDHIKAVNEQLMVKQPDFVQQPETLPAVICSGRTAWSVDLPALKEARPVRPAAASDLADEIMDASDDEPDFISITLPELPETDSPDFQAWISALEEAQSMTAIPFIFTEVTKEQAAKLSVLLRWYHGRAGVMAVEPLNLPDTVACLII